MKKIVRHRPTSPGVRHWVSIDRSELHPGRPVKELTEALRSSGGRANHGRISVWGRGGGHRRRYRLIDFARSVLDTPGVVQRLEYDPNRSAYIALVRFPETGEVCYILAPQGLEVGDTVNASRENEVDIRVGNAMPLSDLPIGTLVHNVELKPGNGGQLSRAAGTSCQLLEKNARPGYALLRNVSKEQRLVPLSCLATVGEVSNPLHKLRELGKAGRARWMGRKPQVRGVAMNPVDHPHGGGQGKTAAGRPSCSPWGVHTKGKKTRDKKKASSRLIVVRKGGVQRG
jgi:large subunit ribosomal protein L2